MLEVTVPEEAKDYPIQTGDYYFGPNDVGPFMNWMEQLGSHAEFTWVEDRTQAEADAGPKQVFHLNMKGHPNAVEILNKFHGLSTLAQSNSIETVQAAYERIIVELRNLKNNVPPMPKENSE